MHNEIISVPFPVVATTVSCAFFQEYSMGIHIFFLLSMVPYYICSSMPFLSSPHILVFKLEPH